MSGYESVSDWIKSDEVMDHSLPDEALEYFRKDEEASIGSKIRKDITMFLDKIMVTTYIVDNIESSNIVIVRGFSKKERMCIDLNSDMTLELYNAICASAARARTIRY